MPVQVIQESLTIAAPQLAPVPIGSDLPRRYPLPDLQISGPAQPIDLPILRLQNEFIQLGIAPSLGGRIVEAIDLRSGTQVLRLPPEITLEPSGPRGFTWNHGLPWNFAPEWPGQLGPVDYRLIEPADPEAKGAIFLFDWHGEISAHTAITLAPGQADFLIEQSIFNRGWTSAEVTSGISSTTVEDGGLYFFHSQPGREAMPVVTETFRLGGRRTHAWQARGIVVSGVKGSAAHTLRASIGIEDSTFWLQSHGSTAQKIFIFAGGQTFESSLPAQPTPAAPTDISALGKPEGVAIEGESGKRNLLWPARESAFPQRTPQSDLWRRVDDLIAGDADPAFYAREPGLEPYAAWKSALAAISAGECEQADAELERYLAFNAEDPLAWWLKASVAREFSLESAEDAPELPNAHFLAPLEPLLKAEAFLRTPIQEGMGPNPLIAGIGHNPPQAIAAVGLYAEVGLRQGMARLADELLRHREFPLLHYLVGAQYLKLSSGEATAAEHVNRAARLMIEPPFPARTIEVEAVLALARRFPHDPNVQVFADLANRSREIS